MRSDGRRPRAPYSLVIFLLLAGLLGAIVLALAVGAAGLTPSETLKVLAALVSQGKDATGDFPSWAPGLLFNLRIPRIVMALSAGAALSCAGASFQGIFRNPLAEPYLLGISAGAALGGTIAILFKPLQVLSIYRVPIFAFVGASLAAFLVYRLATFSGRTGSSALLLAGVAVGSTLTAIMSFIMVATEKDLHTVMVWLMGGLGASTWPKVLIVLPVTAIASAYLWLMSRHLNLLLLGEERAQQLGIDSYKTRRNVMLVASLVTAAAVAFTGLIGFVGLMVPHIMRLIVGPDHRRLLPATALFGGFLLLVADTIARTALAPAEIPVGVITAACGGPFFLYLLRTHRGV